MLKDDCLNLNDGGKGSFTFINKTQSKEQRHKNGLAGGLAYKKQLENNSEQLLELKEKMVQYHNNMPKDKKEEIYNKVSASLKEYYQSEEGRQKQENRNLKNKNTNIQTANQWRTEFKLLFKGKSPEYFRKYNKQKEANDLFKQIRFLNKEIQILEVENFFNKLEEIV